METRILHRGKFLACDSTRRNERQRFSISHIDNREFSGVEGVVPPGPYGYLMFIPSEAIEVIPDATFNLDRWSADSILVSSLFCAPFAHPGV